MFMLLTLPFVGIGQDMKIKWEDNDGREFSVRALSGSFSYSMIPGDNLFYNVDGSVSRIGSVNIYYNVDGSVSRIGRVNIYYNVDGTVSRVGGLSIYYNVDGTISSTRGRIL